jgi:hypothetical protein
MDNEDTESRDPIEPHIELIRIIDRTIHVSPIDRKKEVDFTVRNNSEQDFNFLFLPLREFARDLQVRDEDEQRLNIYPNSEVKEMIEERKDEDKEGYKLLQMQFKHAEYMPYIQLPPDKPLGPGELRTITMTYEEKDSVEFYSIFDPKLYRGWLGQWKRKFFRIPSFIADVQRYSGHTHDVFIVIVGTPGYASIGETEREGADPAKEIYENGVDDDTRVLSVRLPPARNGSYTWDMRYSLIPNNTSLMTVLVGYWWTSVLVGVVSAIIAYCQIFPHLASLGNTLSAGIITATIGLIFALDEDWTNRYRYLSVIPLLIHGASWVLWDLIPNSSG